MLHKIKRWASTLKEQGKILQAVYRHPQTPLQAKILIWITLGYLCSPIDLIPDFIPILGLLDDVIIIPLLIALTIKLIPKSIWAESIESVKDQSQEKWKLNWMIILLIVSAWLFSGYLIFTFLKNLHSI